jgi:hypothetical protein
VSAEAERAPAPPDEPHTRDEQCTVVDGECVICGVTRRAWACVECGGRSFHAPGCSEAG